MIEIDTDSGVVVARIRGDVDMSNTVAVERAIAGAVSSDALGVVLELSEVTYLDSAGVRLLYHLDERASGRQQLVAIVVPAGAPTNRTLEAAGAVGSLRVVGTLEAAVDLVRRGPSADPPR